MTRHGVKDASSNKAQVAAWFNKRPDANVGLATGSASGFFVLDVDAKSGGRETISKLTRRHGNPGATVSALTGGGGYHLLLKIPKGKTVRNFVNIVRGVDVRGDGGYIVAPPSSHVSGTPYRWNPDASPGVEKIIDPPQWLADLVLGIKRDLYRKGKRSYNHVGGKKPRITIDIIGTIGEGERNQRLYKLACRLIWEERDRGEIEAMTHEINRKCCTPPLSDREVDRTLKSALKNYT